MADTRTSGAVARLASLALRRAPWHRRHRQLLAVSKPYLLTVHTERSEDAARALFGGGRGVSAYEERKRNGEPSPQPAVGMILEETA